MQPKLRIHRALALALALALLVPAAATAQGPGTITLQLGVDTGVVQINTMPVTLPNPVIPNPAYDALQALDAAAPADAAVPVMLDDAPDGLYVQAAGKPPIQLASWSPGVEQRRVAPVEFAADTLGMRFISGPTLVTPKATVHGPAFSADGRLQGPALPLEPEVLAVPGDAPAPPPRSDETPVPLDATATLQPSGPAAQGPAERGAGAPLAGSAAATVPIGGEVIAPLTAAALAGAALLALKLLIPLYHRFKRKTALDNPTRQRVYELLRAAPGASAAELSEASALHVTTVKYHLQVLRRVGMVGEEVVDGCRRFFSYENGDRAEFLARALLDEPAARAIFRQIGERPGQPFIEVARSLGMRKEHVHYHVKKLAKHGLIHDRWEAGRRLLYPGAAPAAPPAPQAAEPARGAAIPVPPTALPEVRA